METIKFKLTGLSPLLMHNGLLADPRNKYTKALKEISSKRPKTDADLDEMAHIEFLGGLYTNGNGPCIPAHVLEATLIGRGGAARKEKKGKQAAAGLFVAEDYDIEYEGPRDPEEMWKDERFVATHVVRIQSSKIVRTRPIIEDWSANVEVQYNPNIVNYDEVVRWMHVAGSECGLMDWRPRYGRFSAEVIE